MSTGYRLIKRLLVALLVGTLVFWTSLESLRRGPSLFSPKQDHTNMMLRQTDQAIMTFQVDHKKPPKTLDDLLPDNPALFELPQNQILDGWGRPLQSEFDGKRLVVFSYGRDGKPGGMGLDADLWIDGRNRIDTIPTWHQFLFEMPIRPALVVSIITASLAFVLTFFMVQVPKLSFTGILGTVVWTVAVAIFGMYCAVAMILVLKSGH